MVLSDDLKAAIRHMYAVFSPYKLRAHVAGCSHCVGDADHALIHSLPLESLGTAELRKYAFKAITTWGEVEDFKHFLPRIFELLAFDGGGEWVDPEVVFGKLDYGYWSNWPESERDAIQQLFHVLWNDLLATFPASFDIDCYLCALAQSKLDLQPYLDAWAGSESLSAQQHLARFVDWNLAQLVPRKHKPRLSNAWWDERQDQVRQVMRWIIEEDRVEKLERFVLEASTPETTSAILSDAVNQLIQIQSIASLYPDEFGNKSASNT